VNPSQQGAVAEAAIALEATRQGFGVLKPQFEGGRYDLVFDIAGRLIRVQCKVARRRGGVVDVKARTCRRTAGGRYIRGTYTADEVDAVAAYCPDVDQCYLIPIQAFAKSGCLYLRVSASKNNQRLGVNWASDYEFGAIAQLGERRYGIPEVVGSSPTSSTPKPPLGAALF
jgi:PD-(D/E)XK nuclease superfamily protein